MDYVERFKYDGYCVIPNVISESESLEYIDLVKNVIQNNILVKDYSGRDNRLMNLRDVEPAFNPLYENKILVDIAKSILDVESLDTWKERLYPCEKIMHPPLCNNTLSKSSPNRSLTCYLCLIDTKGIKISKESHLSKPILHNHYNSIKGEGTIHEFFSPNHKNIESLSFCAIFTHYATIISGKNPIDLDGTFSPKIVWEFIDSNLGEVRSSDNNEYARTTITL